MLVSHKQDNIQRTSKLLIEMGLLTKIILMLLLLNMINAKPVFDLIPKRSRTFNGMTLAELRREIMKVRKETLKDIQLQLEKMKRMPVKFYDKEI